MQNLENKFINAIESWRLKLKAWTKSWYSYILEIQKLVWERNLIDWYNIFVFDKKMTQIWTIKIDWNLGKITFNQT